MARARGATMSLSSASGNRLNTRRFICTPTIASAWRAPRLADIWIFIIGGAHIPDPMGVWIATSSGGRLRLLIRSLWRRPMSFDHHSEEPTAIRTNLAAIFVSMELSRSIWMITSLSPGGGEKMSKHSVSAGDIAALLARFSELKQKAFARIGKPFPIIVIEEAGLDGFWIHRVLEREGIES